MQHPFEKELIALANTLQIGIDEAENLPADLSAIKIRVTNALRQQQNFINALIGTTMTTHGKEDSGPLTHIMGIPIEYRQPVTKEQLQPTNAERDKFLADRDNLYNQFLELKNEKIFSYWKQPGGDAVVRAVAKKAGIENYADAKVNDIFVNNIRKAIKAGADLAQSLKDAEDSIK